MKLNICLLLSLGQLAAAGQTLEIRDDVETECYSFDAVDDERTLTYNTYGACAYECADSSKFVIAMRGSGCFCLDSLPPDDKKVDASECNEPCPGYAADVCGGQPGYYSVAAVDASYFGSSNTTDTTASSSATASSSTTASSTTSSTAVVSSSSVPSNSTSSVTPTSSSASGSSASGSSASASPSVESSSAAAPGLGSGVTVVSSFACAVAALVALI